MKINKTSRAILAAAALALAPALAPILAPGSAWAAPARASLLTTRDFSAAEQRATLAYWTPQRQRDAKPADVMSAGNAGPAPATRGTQGTQATRPAGVPGAQAGKPGIVRGGPPAADASGLSFNVPTGLYTTYPYDLNGKIFFDFKGSTYVCSGTSVASYHGRSLENEVWTAGHCVVNTDQNSPGLYVTNLEFIPGYDGSATTVAGRYPFGIFTATAAEAPLAWADNGDISVDEAAVTVGTNSAGQTLGQAVGYDGFIYNQPDNESFTAFGYPQASPYTGNLMVEDIASTDTTYRPAGATGQASVGIVNPMTAGSSGGAWNIDWTTASPGFIDGHNDYTNPLYPGVMFSPYQDTLANEVRCFGATSC